MRQMQQRCHQRSTLVAHEDAPVVALDEVERDRQRSWSLRQLRRGKRVRAPGSECGATADDRTGRAVGLLRSADERAKLASFTRLRLPDNHGENALLPVLRGAALIRELHTYGRHTRVGGDSKQSQHVGFGRRLLAEAERIAREKGYTKLAVISGIGVREYYRKNGYTLEETYMVKYFA